MLNNSNQATLELRLSLYLRHVSDKDKQFRLNLIEYWLSDFDFSDDESENDIAYSFSSIFRVFEAENNSENESRVFQEWFSLLGIYFLKTDNNPYFSERRRLDFASFCLFTVENFIGGNETAKKVGQDAYEKSLSEQGNNERWKDVRPLKKRAIDEYPNAAQFLIRASKKVKYESIAEIVWPKIQPLNYSPNGSEIIDSSDDPIGRLIGWFKRAKKEGDITSPVELGKKK